MARTVLPMDPNGHVKFDYDLDEEVFKTALLVWNSSTLQWERMTQPTVNVDGDLTVTLGDVEMLLMGYYWGDVRYDLDSKGNVLYIGKHITKGAATSDSEWYITKYDYDSKDNVIRRRVMKGIWDNRVILSW